MTAPIVTVNGANTFKMWPDGRWHHTIFWPDGPSVTIAYDGAEIEGVWACGFPSVAALRATLERDAGEGCAFAQTALANWRLGVPIAGGSIVLRD